MLTTNISTPSTLTQHTAAIAKVVPPPPTPVAASAAEGGSSELREAFDDFVGQTFYGLMLKSMRKSVGKPAYFHGGRAEEVFQSQLDQQLVEEMSEATASQFTDPMFELFNLPRMRGKM